MVFWATIWSLSKSLTSCCMASTAEIMLELSGVTFDTDVPSLCNFWSSEFETSMGVSSISCYARSISLKWLFALSSLRTEYSRRCRRAMCTKRLDLIILTTSISFSNFLKASSMTIYFLFLLQQTSLFGRRLLMQNSLICGVVEAVKDTEDALKSFETR